MFDGYRQVFTVVPGATLRLAIAMSASRATASEYPALYAGVPYLSLATPLSLLKAVSLSLEKRSFNVTCWSTAILCVLALNDRCPAVPSASAPSLLLTQALNLYHKYGNQGVVDSRKGIKYWEI
jgi:hypothetical protein